MIGANPVSPPYTYIYIQLSFHNNHRFLILSNLERYKHNWYFSRDRYSLTIPKRKYVSTDKEISCSEYHNRILRAIPFKVKGKICIVF